MTNFNSEEVLITMSKTEAKKKTEDKPSKSGSKIAISLVTIVVIGIGVFAYFSGKITGDKLSGAETETAQAQPAAEESEDATKQASAQAPLTAPPAPAPLPPPTIKPGNPVVAKLDGKDIKRLDVLKFIQTLPQETQQLPVGQLFPLAVEQVINAALIAGQVKKVNLDDDPVVKQQIANAKQQITRTVFLQKEVEKAMTDERLQQAYKLYAENFQQPEEANAKHILVADEALAKTLIKKLDEGASFEELAKENSKDSSAKRGGDVGYFTKKDVVPEFAEAAFSMEKGAYTKKPVKSQFGYHVIKLEERRKRPIPEFAQAKPFLEGQLRGALLNKIIQDWREEAKVERFDINGDAIKAAGQEPTAGEAPKE